MELVSHYLLSFVHTAGWLSPLIFISFHLVRPLLFLPVIFLCISGGILFGAIAGTVYSIIGITLSSIVFYLVLRWMPKTSQRFIQLKHKIVGQHVHVSVPQITLLRLIPFIHFHLLSLCLFENALSFKEYTRTSLLTSIPFAMIYTTMGQWLSTISPLYILMIILAMIPLLYVIRRKEYSIKWEEFFQFST
ncbi:MAG TPA: VTT domain-containing protein [Virgibacillus sp.]|nr:VTT domain-containing protein [Virgibacillus sp.]